MSKIIENTFRAVNIALVNELAILADRMGVDIWEAIEAASTKPFGFMPFWPGPGLGGHCIPIDPFYLAWRARAFDMDSGFVELAGRVNVNMPYYAVSRIARSLNGRSKAVREAKVLILGMAYKADVGDLRESPSLKLLELLRAEGADVTYHDPHVATLADEGLSSVELTASTWSRPTASSSPRPTQPSTSRPSSSTPISWSTCAMPCGSASAEARRERSRPTSTCSSLGQAMPAPSRKVWIDLTNSPHVLFFRPILRRLDEAGVETVVTARDFAQTLGLLERYRHPAHRHRPPRRRLGQAGKGLGLVRRSGSLVALRARPAASPRPSATAPTTSPSRRACCASTARCSTTTKAPRACTASTSVSPPRS